MIRTAPILSVLALAFATILNAVPAYAQRVFVSGSGSDSNPCTFAQPCRTFQQAFNTVPANGEIDVLDPAGYGALAITHAISIQGHGFGGITQATHSASAITISAGSADAVTLNGLLIDGADTGSDGILVVTAGSVQILDCVIRHFASAAISASPASGHVLVSDTVASDSKDGMYVNSSGVLIRLNRVTVNNNQYGLFVGGGKMLIKNSVLSNNSNAGLDDDGATIWLGTSEVSGNGTGIEVFAGSVNSYGDNDVDGSITIDVSGSLTAALTQ